MNPWMILGLIVALGAAYFLGHVNGASAQLETDQLVAAKVERGRNEADFKARAKYAADLAERDRQIAELRAAEAEAAATYAKELASARAVAAPITREVVRYVATNPSPDTCRVPARILELRRAQIRAANTTGRIAAPVAASGLRRVPEGHPAGAAGADQRRPGPALDGRRLHHPGIWRGAPASPGARGLC